MKLTLVDIYSTIIFMIEQKKNSYSLLILITVLALVSGFIIGNLSPSVFPKNQIPSATDEGKSLYTNQSATIQGTITKVEGNRLYVENKNGTTGDVEALDTLIVNKLDSKPTSGPLASNSAQINSIETNKDVLITLQFKDGEYKAVTISYLPPLPKAPSLSPVPRATSVKN